ncbi:MAG: methyltransferase domain-containing protein [Bacteroidota bacterium]|nr:methyltransferase domain-containing protein [Bacteroidota bacterium]
MENINWDSSLYDNNHDFVSSLGEDLLQLLAPEKNQSILDLGCGTGHLAAKIATSGAFVCGIDSSEDMIKAARENYHELDFEVKDGRDFYFKEPFDAIFSNATLHWITEQDKVLQCVYNNLIAGGKFVAEFGGKGNIAQMIDAFKVSRKKLNLGPLTDTNDYWYFPSIGEYTPLLEQAGFLVIYAVHFDRPTILSGANGIKDWFRMFGGRLMEDLTATEIELAMEETQKILKPVLYKNGSWEADYSRIRIVALKLL